MSEEPITPTMAAAGLSFIDIQAVAESAVKLLQTEGDTALRVVNNTMKLIKAVTGKDMLGVFSAINAITVDVQTIIAAVKAEFGI